MSGTLGPKEFGQDLVKKATASFAVDVTSADVDLSAQFADGFARWIDCVAGTIAVQMTGDAAPVIYTTVNGQRLEGHFVKVAKSGTSPATGWVAQN